MPEKYESVANEIDRCHYSSTETGRYIIPKINDEFGKELAKDFKKPLVGLTGRSVRRQSAKGMGAFVVILGITTKQKEISKARELLGMNEEEIRDDAIKCKHGFCAVAVRR